MDNEYWKNYYKKLEVSGELNKPSTFAEFCWNFLKNEKLSSMIDLGCGNGRDAEFFCRNGLKTCGIDLAITGEIGLQNSEDSMAIRYISDNFVSFDYGKLGLIDFFYSRFTLHAITEDDEIALINNVYKFLPSTGIFAVEARTIKDPLYGKGVDYGNNVFMTDHKRRFIVANSFLRSLMDRGFELLYFIEANNLSIYKDDNPVLLRIIVRK